MASKDLGVQICSSSMNHDHELFHSITPVSLIVSLLDVVLLHFHDLTDAWIHQGIELLERITDTAT